ncbi:MAG: DUF354 domain-containing protein [Candidatus Hodarchaeota archaeon]
MKIWIDMTTPFQCNLYTYVLDKLDDRFNSIITCRKHDSIIPILESKRLPFIPIGRHGGKTQKGKLKCYCERVNELSDFLEEEKPDLLLTERDPASVRAAFGFGIPAYPLFYDEREYWVNRMVFPLAYEFFVPSFYIPRELDEEAASPSKALWFNGLHTTYMKNCKLESENPWERDYDINHPIILVRPELNHATFGPEQTKPILENTIPFLTEKFPDASIIVLPRNPEQETRFRSIDNVIIPKDALPEVPVAYTDLVIGAAETMLQEAFSIAVPAISCVYWELSKPMQYLHTQIPNPNHHHNNPQTIANIAEELLETRNKWIYVGRAEKALAKMHDISEFIANHLKMLKSVNELEAIKKTMMSVDEGRFFQRPTLEDFQITT